MDELSLRDILDSIEGCERLIQYYTLKLKELELQPINMKSRDDFDVYVDDADFYRAQDMNDCRAKIKELNDTKLRLMGSIENNITFRIATGNVQKGFDRIK